MMPTLDTEHKIPNPDDCLVIRIGVHNNAKQNPNADDPIPLDFIDSETSLRCEEAEQYLTELLDAVRGRRLYGLVAQEIAVHALESKAWILKTGEEILAEARADDRDNNG